MSKPTNDAFVEIGLGLRLGLGLSLTRARVKLYVLFRVTGYKFGLGPGEAAWFA